ncbi:MAG TPA: PASTA domain-containing protein, partial [Longimicrobium sp.]|nr:PASTA domain-containing protein [Longimicrobium sp.]
LGAVDSAAARAATPGTVVGQAPRAGERVQPGTFVTVTVAQAPRATMPSLVGRPVEEARRTLVAAGLRAGEVTERDAQGAAGRVLTQSVPAGTRVRPGMTVDLAVSRVPVVVRPDTPRATMPSLVGRPVAEARRTLVAAGLRAGDVTERDAQGTAGRVLTQSIPAGTPVRPGMTVDLAVSRVPAVVQQDTPVRTAQQDTPAATQPETVVDSAVAVVPDTAAMTQPEIVATQPVVAETAAALPVRLPTSQPGSPALLGLPREVLWGVIALLVLAAAAILYRITRGGGRQPVPAQPPAAVPPPASAAVRLSVAGGEWESAAQADAAAGPVQGGKLRLNVRIAEPLPMAEAAGEGAGAALGAMRVAVRMKDDAADMAARMDDSAPVLAGAAMQVRVRDGEPELTVDEDTDILGRRA